VVRSVNGISVRSAEAGAWNPQYAEMLQLISLLQDADALGVGSEGNERPYPTLKFRDTNTDTQTAKAIMELRKLWGLDPNISEYRLLFGLIPDKPNEIAVLTSSILDLLRDLAAFIEVPPEHIADGQTSATIKLPPDAWLGRPPIRVQVASERPDNAFIAVEKDAWWYWISKNSLRSKRVFTLLTILLQLADTGDKATGPPVTIGLGN